MADKKMASSENIIKLEREWPQRLVGLSMFLCIVWLLAGAIVIFRGDLINKQINLVLDNFYDWCGKQGLVLEDVVISGRNRTEKQDVIDKLNLQRGANMLKINIYDLKQKLEELPWVGEVLISKKYFPHILNIQIIEKQVHAIWQINEKFYPLDGNGEVINAEFKITEPILLIVGDGAPENFKLLMSVLKNEDADYVSRVKVANFISKRRWNLILDDIRSGVTVKLPEDNLAEAWKKLVKLDKSKGIFKRKLTILDLRLKDKIVVKLRKGPSGELPKLSSEAEHNL